MFGIELDALDPTLFAVGVLIGSIGTVFVLKRTDKITRTLNNAFAGTRYGKRVGLKRI